MRKRFPPGPESVEFKLQIELEAGPGITVLFGPSGSGKTLTLDCIAGFMRPDEGRILLDDAILYDGAAGVHLPPRARRCGYVFQNYALFPHMTLRENLEFAVHALPRAERTRRIAEMLDRFHLADVAGRRPHELSGGQKQRCSIARALLTRPALLLLDEPARGLDMPLRAELYNVLREIRAGFEIPILLVTHNLEESLELGDEMLVLRSGSVVQSGAPAAVVDRPATVDVARLLGLYNLFAVEILALDPGRNSSRVRLGDFEIAGPYYPGRLLGDHVWLCVRPDQLRALPRNGRASSNQLPAQLLRSVPRAGFVRLEFAEEVAVEMPARDFQPLAGVRDWWIEFPPKELRVL